MDNYFIFFMNTEKQMNKNYFYFENVHQQRTNLDITFFFVWGSFFFFGGSE